METNKLITEKDSIIANQKNIIIEKEIKIDEGIELFTFILGTKNKTDPQILSD